MERQAVVTRKTAETDIMVSLNLDGAGTGKIDTGIGFFDHMLSLLARHGIFDLTVEAKGDLHIDAHHTVEDTGIVLGQALSKALGEKRGIKRYGNAFVPMDEALAMVCVDISGRPFLAYEAQFSCQSLGGFDTELVEEFLRAVTVNAGLTLHVRLLAGKNAHHMIEAIFKALGKALDEATQLNSRIEGVLSTKGSL